MATSKKKLTVFCPVKPVPAARVKVTRWGGYFPKNYTNFRIEMKRWLSKQKKFWKAYKSQYKVVLEVLCKSPKKPTNPYPRGDVDNYAKAYLDCITNAGLIWKDDIEVIELKVKKRYPKEGEDFGASITIQEL
jgi:Holliday junction resolvase RusA-like endonuclease